MPKLSDRANYIKQLEFLIGMLSLTDQEDTEEFQEVMELRIMLEYTRNINSIQRVPKSDAFRQILLEYNEPSFNLFVRMSRTSFYRNLQLIKDHEVFQNKSNLKQERIWT